MFSDKFGHGFSSFYEDVEQYELTVPEVNHHEPDNPKLLISQVQHTLGTSTDMGRDTKPGASGPHGAGSDDDVIRAAAPGRDASAPGAVSAVRAGSAADGNAVCSVHPVRPAANHLRAGWCLMPRIAKWSSVV